MAAFKLTTLILIYIHNSVQTYETFKIFFVRVIKGPCLPKPLCALMLLLRNGSFVERSDLIVCDFPNDKMRNLPRAVNILLKDLHGQLSL